MIIHLSVLSQTDVNVKKPLVLSILEGIGLSSSCITSQSEEQNSNGVVNKLNLSIDLESKVTTEQVETAISAVFSTATYSAVSTPAPTPTPSESEE